MYTYVCMSKSGYVCVLDMSNEFTHARTYTHTISYSRLGPALQATAESTCRDLEKAALWVREWAQAFM